MASKQVRKNVKVEEPMVEEVVQEPVVEEVVVEPKPEITGYLVPILFKREPNDKDVPVADIFYRQAANLIELECHKPNHEASIEMIIAGDISVPTTTGAINMISKSESPIKWITNLCNSNEFSGHPFIAREAQEIYEA